MRTALLSSLAVTPQDRAVASLKLGARTILEWQIELAIMLGCERIICLTHDVDSKLYRAQQQLEDKGVDFQIIRNSLQLVSLVSADHEILVLADGLLADKSLIKKAFEGGYGIISLPAAVGIAAGWERIDADHAWGGALLVRANIVQKIAEFPPDSDAVSLLLRLALQSGQPLINFTEDALASRQLFLAQDSQSLEQREKDLISASKTQVSWMSPGIALSAVAARLLSPFALGSGPLIGLISASIFMGFGLFAASRGQIFPSLALLFLGVLSLDLGHALAQLRSRLHEISANDKLWLYNNILFDIILIACLVLPEPFRALDGGLPGGLVMVALVRLAQVSLGPKWRALWADRAVLLVLLMAGAWLGWLTPAIAAISLAALALLLVRTARYGFAT